MRATLAFLNGAGSRRALQSTATDCGKLALTDLLIINCRARLAVRDAAQLRPQRRPPRRL